MKIAPRLLVPLVCLAGLMTVHCYSARPIEVASLHDDSMPTHDRISAVTLTNGTMVKFDAHEPSSLLKDSMLGTERGSLRAIPMDSVQRVWVSHIDGVRTSLAVIGAAVLVTAGVAAIALATKQSCPFIYAWDGNKYVFNAEPYGGAITRGLERDDYGELPSLVDDHGSYRLLVTNEVNETQFTNQLQLLVVDHPADEQIKVDEFGHFYGFTSLAPPTTAVDQDGRDLRPWLAANDEIIWEPVAPPDAAHGARQEITLTFAKPAAATKGFLVARVATGLWGSQMIRQFSALRGTSLTAWYAGIDTSRTQADALRQWNFREELYALQLNIEEPTGWALRGVLPGGGPFLAAERVVPLDLRNVRGDSVRIRIRPPYGFWALNSFAMAYDTLGTVGVVTLAPSVARTSDGEDVLADLTSADDRYYKMPNTGDYAHVTFVAPPLAPGMTRTVFTHARGYYRLHLDPSTPPDTATLARLFGTPDAAANFAAARFAQQFPRGPLTH